MQHVYIPFLDETLFQLFYYFCWWSVFGWFLEVVVRTVETGGFENRGFLNGPFCPIYGFGVTIIVHVLEPISGNFLLLYFLSSAICTTFELFVGLLMEKLFKARWWDYSAEKFNFKGLICLRIALLWGVGSVMVIDIVQPLILKTISFIPYLFGNILAGIIMTIIIIDLIATLGDIRNFNNMLRQVDFIAKQLHDKSINLGKNISDEVLELESKYDKIDEKLKLEEKYEKLEEKYEKLAEQIKNSRLVRAFPTMRPVNYTHTFKVIIGKISNKFSPIDYDEKYENTKLIISDSSNTDKIKTAKQ